MYKMYTRLYMWWFVCFYDIICHYIHIILYGMWLYNYLDLTLFSLLDTFWTFPAVGQIFVDSALRCNIRMLLLVTWWMEDLPAYTTFIYGCVNRLISGGNAKTIRWTHAAHHTVGIGRQFGLDKWKNPRINQLKWWDLFHVNRHTSETNVLIVIIPTF